MPAKISSTIDMEGAIKAMISRSDKCIINNSYYNSKKIKLRPTFIHEIKPITICWYETPNREERIANWKSGPIWFEGRGVYDLNAEALFLPECPLRYDIFKKLTRGIERDIIVYKPSSWMFHDMTANQRYSRRDVQIALKILIEELEGKERTEHQIAVRDHLLPSRSVAFHLHEIGEMLGMSGTLTKKAIIRHCDNKLRGYYPMRLIHPPQDAGLLELYKAYADGPELLPGINFPGKIGKYRHFRRMQQDRNIIAYTPIMAILLPYLDKDIDMWDARVNAKLGAWYKMKNIIDEAEEYPL